MLPLLLMLLPLVADGCHYARPLKSAHSHRYHTHTHSLCRSLSLYAMFELADLISLVV